MKKIFLIIAIFTVFLNAHEEQDGKAKINDLIILPGIGKAIKANEKDIAITKEQDEQMIEKIKSVFPQKVQEVRQKVVIIETKVQEGILNGATSNELEKDLEEIAKLKIELAKIKIEALNNLKKILTKEQWNKIIQYLK